MDYMDALKPGKREGAFHVEYKDNDNEKIGRNSPNNRRFYAYVWDHEQQKTVAVCLESKDLVFR